MKDRRPRGGCRRGLAASFVPWVVRLRPPVDDTQMPSQFHGSLRIQGRAAALRRSRPSICTNALDHGAEPVRALRGEMLAQAKPLENLDSIHRKDVAGPLAGEN